MVKLQTNQEKLKNELADVVRIFFPEKVEWEEEKGIEQAPFQGWHFVHIREEATKTDQITCYQKGHLAFQKNYEFPLLDELPLSPEKKKKYTAKMAMTKALKEITGFCPPWGGLTGIRPTKLARELTQSLGLERARRLFLDFFEVSQEKTALAFQIAHHQMEVIDSIAPEDVDIYISIPFCVGRCCYCSFPSNDMEKLGEGRQIEFLDALEWEIEACRELWETRNLRCVYIGGGTPTALTEANFKRLVQMMLPLSSRCKEYTIEAGRPDTITRQKLEIMKEALVDRISINTQTTEDETLRRIGRKHTAQDFFDAFQMARDTGFSFINTDLIVGLPGEGEEQIIQSLQDVVALKPENITVHSLAIKRASQYGMGQAEFESMEEHLASQVIERSQQIMAECGYEPYYLYRQKYMTGNLENVGYERAGHACIYNIDMMEEVCSVLAFGAGAISKRVILQQNRLERAANVKDLKTYLERTTDMALRKKKLFSEEK